MHFHLLSLSTCQPHPEARTPVLAWPSTLGRKKIQLAFQICDDGLFVLNRSVPGGPHDQLVGWQWTTGRQGVVSLLAIVLAVIQVDSMADGF